MPISQNMASLWDLSMGCLSVSRLVISVPQPTSTLPAVGLGCDAGIRIDHANLESSYFVRDGLTRSEPFQDSFNVTGKQSTLGFVSYLAHDVATSNAPLLDILLQLGAVLYIKTNIPQTLMVSRVKDPEN